MISGGTTTFRTPYCRQGGLRSVRQDGVLLKVRSGQYKHGTVEDRDRSVQTLNCRGSGQVSSRCSSVDGQDSTERSTVDGQDSTERNIVAGQARSVRNAVSSRVWSGQVRIFE